MKVRILLVETDLVLPVGQPVPLQSAAAAGELLFQSTVIQVGACQPGGGKGRASRGSGVDGWGSDDWSGRAGVAPRGGHGQVCIL